MSSKHTLGPWKAYPNSVIQAGRKDKSGFIVIQEKRINAGNIASIIPCSGMTTEEIVANANLIESSPDMYIALKSVNQYFIDLQNRFKLSPSDERVWKAVSKAIAKAEGRL